MRLLEFKVIGAEYPILINADHIVTILWSGIAKTEIRLINGGVHIVDGSFEDTKKRLKNSIVPNAVHLELKDCEFAEARGKGSLNSGDV
jgi:hypothetical protein